MKFLLAAVNAKYIHSNPAIYSLRAYAGETLQEHIEIAEYTINNRLQDILADIYQRKPEAIGFSCYIWNWTLIQDLLREIPKILPGTDIWLGGPEVSYDGEEILKNYPQVTGIMVGEGEETFRELLEYYVKWFAAEHSGERQFSGIAGLCLPTGKTSARELSDMGSLPFLYENLDTFANRIIYYESSRGCPYRCSYCLSSIDKTVRLRDTSVVKKELQFFLDNKVSQVKFVDRTFNCNHQHAMEIWRYIYENDNGVTNFHFEISADILREEEIALLQKFRPGLAQLEIGVQSVNEETLSAIHRAMSVDRLEKVVAALREGANIHLHLDLIAGLPYEDYESFAHSFNRVYAMKPEQLQLGFLKVLKGSEMQERATELGICYMDQPPYEVLYTKWLSYNEVLRLKQIEEMVEMYYNSNQFVHTMEFLLQAFEGPFAMYEALAEFYRQEGYFQNSPARAYRYQVLLHFVKKHDAEHLEIYKELLTYDMYLRENLKSRPEFASDDMSEEEKAAIREFYRAEEVQKTVLTSYQGYDWKQLSKMTHIEAFYYPVWKVQELLSLRESEETVTNVADKNAQSPTYILFDYRNRNPLTYDAATHFIILEM